MKKILLMVLSLFSLLLFTSVDAQKKKTAVASAEQAGMAQDPIVKAQNFRLIGPFRGGRAAAGVGSFSDVNTFYMGATGGGVWKTTDAGNNWKNISDGFFGGTGGGFFSFLGRGRGGGGGFFVDHELYVVFVGARSRGL